MTTGPRTQPPGTPAPIRPLSGPAGTFLAWWLAESNPTTARALKEGPVSLSGARIEALLSELEEETNVAGQDQAVRELRTRRADLRELDAARADITTIREIGYARFQRQAEEAARAGAEDLGGFERLCSALGLSQEHNQGQLEHFPTSDDVHRRAHELGLPS